MANASEQRFIDPYQQLAQPLSFGDRLQHLYRVLREQYSGIDRLSLALYQPDSDQLSTFTCAGDDASPLTGYSVLLDAVPSLKVLADNPLVRVVGDMREFRSDELSTHTAALLGQGYRSSLTMPLTVEGHFLGMLFLNARTIDYFSAPMAAYCTLWGHLVGQTLAQEQETLRRLHALARWALDVSGVRCIESDDHMQRMAAYTRLIARQLQSSQPLSDSWIEYLTLFAPLHDIGKISVPDRILHKPGSLTAEEFDEMKRHVSGGKTLLEKAIRRFDLGRIEHIDMLMNIIQYHHEKLDGSGYLGLNGTHEIPLEARIVAVADILDALLNARCYKQAWEEDAVWQELERLSGRQLDPDCVAAVLDNKAAIQDIQQRWPAR
jgi:hypothetical protein